MSRRVDAAVAAALALAAVLAALYVAYALRDDHVGDATIYLSYARNAADGHPFQFNVGEFSSGSTSPLWSLVLALPYLLGGGIGGAKVVAAVFAAVAVLATLYAAREVSRSWAAAAVATLFVPGAMTFYPASLYESGLVVALGALAVALGARTMRAWGERGALTAGAAAPLAAVWAALPLARPDAAVLVAAQAVAMLAFAPVERRRAAVALLATLAVAAIPAAAYFGYSTIELGTPSTSSDARAYALQEFARDFVGPLYRNAEAVREVLGSPWIFAFLPGLAGLGLMARRAETRWLALHGALSIGAYLFMLSFVAPGFHDTARYLLPLVPVIVCSAAYLLARVPGPAARAGAMAVAALAIGLASADRLNDDLDLLASFGIDEHEVFSREPTSRVNALAAPGDVLLSYEVQLRYFLRDDVRVLSEDGIVDGKVADFQPSGDMTGFLLRHRPRWWIADENVRTRPYMRGSVLDRALLAFRSDRSTPSRTLDGVRFDLVARRSTPLQPGFGGWQMLFRLAYPGRGSSP
ncbi:MAG TPA: hypothetical protein VF520_14440 [Thermoleophilaceae bacterium]|jgi:hypothetical protein